VVLRARRDRSTLRCAAIVTVATLAAVTLTACAASAPPALDGPDGSAPIVTTTPAHPVGGGRRADRVPVPFDVASFSPAITSLSLQYRLAMCQSLDGVEIGHSTGTRYGQPVRVTTLTVWAHNAGNGCVGGLGTPTTTTVHLAVAPMGCNAELIDGATGRPATFVSGVEPPLWNCPMMPQPAATIS
jgi:hypothetical protein